MKPWQFLRTTLVGGLFLLVPLAVVGIIALKIMAFGRPITVRFAELFGITHGVMMLEVAALLLLCLIAGLLMRSARVGNLREWLERNILSLLPGYEYVRMRIYETLAPDEVDGQHAVLVRFDDNVCPGRLIERNAEGTCVVFLPDTPACNTGTVVIVEAERVEPLDVPYSKLLSSIRNYGKGLLALRTGAGRQHTTP